jgi:hypothetical protein
VLIDLGRHDGGQGAPTTSPDVNGNYWNSWSGGVGTIANGNSLTGLVTINNNPSEVTITAASEWNNNGYNTGGLLNPNSALLGEFAIGTATGDYYYFSGSPGDTRTLRLAGLDPSRQYNLSLFATRTTTASDTRTVRYSVADVNGAHTVDLQVSGPGAGSVANPYGNDDTIAILTDLVPDESGQIDLATSIVNGGFAYLGILKVTPAPVANSIFLPPVKIPGGWQLQFNATPSVKYRVQRASEVSGPWGDLGSVVGSSDGITAFDDTDAPHARAFYRTVSP